MRGRTRTAAALAGTLAFGLVLADERLMRWVDWRTGAPFSSVANFDQDADGFLWIGVAEGLVRYDGTELRIVDPRPSTLASGCARQGKVRTILHLENGVELAELDRDRLVAIPPPDGVRLADDTAAACSDDDALWIAARGDLWRRDERNGWKRIKAKDDATSWDGLWSGPRGDVLARSGAGVFRVAPDGAADLLAPVRNALFCLLEADGTLVALDWRRDGGHLLRARRGRLEDLAHLPRRPMGLAERQGTLWAAFDTELLGLRPDGTRSVIPISASMPSGGPLLVDHEGALWVGTFRGLVQFPEPDTVGLDLGTPNLGRWIHDIDGIAMSTWGQLLRAVQRDGQWSLAETGVFSVGAVCRDARGRLWGGLPESLLRVDPDGHRHEVSLENLGSLAPCELDDRGTLWMPTQRGLLRLEKRADEPTIEPLPLATGSGSESTSTVMLDTSGRLWVGMEQRVCIGAPSASGSRSWSCEPVPSGYGVTDLLEVEPGRVWAASWKLYERGADGTWHPLDFETEEAAQLSVSGLAASPRGGVWLLGARTIARVAVDTVHGRLRTLERLGAWQGMPTDSATDALEDDGGAVWLATNASLVRVSPDARTLQVAPARVAITSLWVDGKSIDMEHEFRSPYRRNRLEVHVSAFSYRDPSLLRYRFRMRDADPWSEATSSPTFHFYNVSSGRYALRFAASLDGEHWTETASPLVFRIDRPWFLQAWFLGIVGACALGVLYTMHRARTARLLALERQRTRIAMDLHDAIGSGLGSIGLLAGLGSQAETGAEKRRELADQVATMAAEMGMSLSEIVWSLGSGSERLEALAQYLTERARTLFVEEKPRFVTDLPPSWPDTQLSLPLRRSLLLIALEALHNAARHAEASEVRLGMAPDGSGWSLSVEDDGLGLSRGVRPGGGMGLDNMKRRAAEIGARLEWSSGAAGGTRVTVLFDPRSQRG